MGFLDHSNIVNQRWIIVCFYYEQNMIINFYTVQTKNHSKKEISENTLNGSKPNSGFVLSNLSKILWILWMIAFIRQLYRQICMYMIRRFMGSSISGMNLYEVAVGVGTTDLSTNQGQVFRRADSTPAQHQQPINSNYCHAYSRLRHNSFTC